MKKALTRTVIVVGGILVLLLATGGVALLLIQSQLVARQLLPYVVETVRTQFQTDLQLGKLSIRLLSGVEIDELKVRVDQPTLKADLKVDRVRVQYSPWALLNRDVSLRVVHLDGVTGTVALSLDPALPAKDVKPLALDELNQSLHAALSALPVKVALGSLRVTLMDLDIRGFTGDQEPRPLARIERAALEATAELTQSDLSANGIFTLQSSAPVEWADPSVKVSVVPGVTVPVLFKLSVPTADRLSGELTLKPSIDLASLSVSQGTAPASTVDRVLIEKECSLSVSTEGKNLSALEFTLTRLSVKADGIRSAPLATKAPLNVAIETKGGMSGADRTVTLATTVTASEKLSKLTHDLSVKLSDSSGPLMDLMLGSVPRSWTVAVKSHLQLDPVQDGGIRAGRSAMDVDAELSGRGSALTLASVNLSAGIDSLLTGYESQVPATLFKEGLSAELSATVQELSSVELKKFEVKNRDGSLNIEASGGGSLNRILLRGRAKATLGSAGDMQGSGSIDVPWQMVRLNDRIQLRGTVGLNNVSARMPGLEIRGVKGKIPIAEDLIVALPATVKFHHVLARNPFERVDYGSLERYLNELPVNFEFERLTVDKRSVGPFISNLKIEQNGIFVNRYDLSLFSGLLVGRMFVNLSEREVAILSRLTGLNPELLVPPTAGARSTGESGIISSRVALNYNFDKSSLEGRVDVTDIGGKQLIALLNVLDPELKDDLLNTARFALRLAYPKYVGMNFYQGVLDLSMELGGAAPVTIPVKGVPATPMVELVTRDLIPASIRR